MAGFDLPPIDDQTRERRALEAWLASGGKIGDCPEWYARIWLAGKLQIPPWEIDPVNPVHVVWMEHAKAGALAERNAQEEAYRRARRKRGA